jgi:stage II sporulation protein M
VIFTGGALTRILVDEPLFTLGNNYSYDVSRHSKDIHDIFWFILGNNLKLNLIIILSSLLLGLPVLIYLFSNGFLLCDFIAANVDSMGMFKILVLIVPHGLIEVMTLLFAASISFDIAYSMYKYFANGEKIAKVFWGRIFRNIILVILLTSVAALIETYVTIGLIL